MEIMFGSELAWPVATKDVLLSMAAVETLRALFLDMQKNFGDQAWEETYWLKSNGDLMYKIKGEIPEAIQFCSIGPQHWNIHSEYTN